MRRSLRQGGYRQANLGTLRGHRELPQALAIRQALPPHGGAGASCANYGKLGELLAGSGDSAGAIATPACTLDCRKSWRDPRARHFRVGATSAACYVIPRLADRPGRRDGARLLFDEPGHSGF